MAASKTRKKPAKRRSKEAAAAPKEKSAAAEQLTPWYGSTLALSLASGLLLWAAFPPWNLAPLAWIAPLFWLLLVQAKQLPGKRPYRAIWLAALVHWLLMLQGIRLAHWTLYFGWIALSFYLAFYPPLFVSLARIAVHRWRVSLLVAAPVVWTALELARGYVITGFSAGLLGHTQVGWTSLIQVSDIFGAYGVSFLLMLGCAALTMLIPLQGRRARYWPMAAAVLALAAALFYGSYRLERSPNNPPAEKTTRIAIIQGSYDTIFEYNPQRNRDAFAECFDLSIQAMQSNPRLDLIIWPESLFNRNEPDLIFQGEINPPPGFEISPEEFRLAAQRAAASFRDKTKYVAGNLNGTFLNSKSPAAPPEKEISLLVGVQTEKYSEKGIDHYNTAMLIDPQGEVVGRYYKTHPVMFGEYIPFARSIPFLYQITPMPHGLTPGEGPRVFEINDLRLTTNICFESTVPHLIRRQVVHLHRQGQTPDVLVNLTNDGWFWESSILDLHFNCAVFRAVENRRPFLSAANTGLSGWIDSQGRIRERLPRGKGGVIVAEIGSNQERTIHHRIGDSPAAACLLFTIAAALVGLVSVFSRAKKAAQTSDNQSDQSAN